jgi:hypothetical protein
MRLAHGMVITSLMYSQKQGFHRHIQDARPNPLKFKVAAKLGEFLAHVSA